MDLQNLINETLFNFNGITDTINLGNYLIVFNKNKKMCVVGDKTNDTILVFYKLGDEGSIQWDETYRYELRNNKISIDPKLTISSLSLHNSGESIAVGLINSSLDLRGGCLILSIHNNSFLIEDQILYPDSKEMNYFGSYVKFHQDMLFIFCIKMLEHNHGSEYIFFYKKNEDNNYELNGCINSENHDINRILPAIIVHESNVIILVDILVENKTASSPMYLKQLALLVIDNDSTDRIINSDRIFQNNTSYYLNIITNDKTFILIRCMDNTLDDSEKLLNKKSPLSDNFCLTLSNSNVTTVDINTPVIEKEQIIEPVDTNKISMEEERHKMLLRSHLVFQQLMNNISIHIKEDKPIDFKLKGLEITADRIKISNLEFINKEG